MIACFLGHCDDATWQQDQFHWLTAVERSYEETTTYLPSGHTGMGSNWEKWRPLVAEFFPASELDTAMCVIRYESGGNPNAVNSRSGATGLFQIMPQWKSSYPGDYTDPTTNTKVARKIWNSGGWSHWNAQGKC